MSDSPSLTHHLENEEAYKPLGGLKRCIFRKHLGGELGSIKGLNVVEFGSGIGTNRRLLRGSKDNWQEVELNPELVAHSQERDPNGEFVCADAISHISDLVAGSVDVVIGFNAIDQFNFEQSEELIKAAHRALRPGGVFMHLSDQAQASGLAYSYFKQEQTSKTTRWLCEPIPAGVKCGALISGSKKSIRKVEKIFASRLLNISPDQRVVTDVTPKDALVYQGSIEEAVEICHKNGVEAYDPNQAQSQAVFSMLEARFGAAVSKTWVAGPKLALAKSKEDPPILIGGENFDLATQRISKVNIDMLMLTRKLLPLIQLRVYSAQIESAIKS